MEIIQSYWSCRREDLLRAPVGWLSPEYNLMSWALSCLRLRRHYEHVTLYADSNAARYLVDRLRLPYTEVVCNLDSLNHYHPRLWAIPKIFVYGLQEQPFLHVDGDVFIWKAFGTELLSGGIIAQNLEAATRYYEDIMQSLEANLTYFPAEVLAERKRHPDILAFNTGIFGGHDLEFIRRYAGTAFRFVDKNLAALAKISVSHFNIFFEQYLLHCMTQDEGKEVRVLLDEVIGDNEYVGFGDFMDVPHQRTYLHLLGSYKIRDIVCSLMADRLRLEYPEYYYRIISLFKQAGAPLYKDYYTFEGSYSEEELLDRSERLKEAYREKANMHSGPSRDIGPEYLYGRDLHTHGYFGIVFADPDTLREKVLVADSLVHMETGEEAEGDAPHRATVPECHQRGPSTYGMDDLDLLIWETLQTPLTIGELMTEVEKSFDPEEVAAERGAFEALILGRLKMGLQFKLYRAATPQSRG